jgi:uncharacterized RDD family membrane protein YckC
MDSLPLAGRGRRLVATLIDAVLVPALTLLAVMVTDVMEDAEDYVDILWIVHVFLLAVASYLALNGYLLWSRGQTIGKAIMGIAIVSHATGDPAPLWKLVCVRALAFPVLYLLVVPPLTVLPLIDLAFIFGKQRRCLHDRLAGTSVVTTSGALQPA